MKFKVYIFYLCDCAYLVFTDLLSSNEEKNYHQM